LPIASNDAQLVAVLLAILMTFGVIVALASFV
jgi:hypothetical protein